MKNELKTYSIDIPRDAKDGLITKDFFLKIHEIMYKYRKFGHDLVMDANTSCRLECLAQIQELKKQDGEDDANPQGGQPLMNVDEMTKGQWQQ